MLDRPSADRTAFLLLWFFRQPSRYQAEGRRRDAPMLDCEVILKLALGRRVDFADPGLEGPATAATLKDAAASYVRHMFFRPDATPYQTLGLAPGASQAAIRESFRLLMQLVHPDRQDVQLRWPESFAAQANRAYGILRNRDSREKFDREAQVRAAGARAAYRAAAASAASMMPTVQRPRASSWGNGPLSRLGLPEWLTAGVGGFVRAHPATVAIAVLIAGAGVIIGTTFLDAREGALMRVARENPAPAVAAVATTAPTSATPAALVASAGEPGAGADVRAGNRTQVATDARGSAERSVAAHSTAPSTGAPAPPPDGDSASSVALPEPVAMASARRESAPAVGPTAMGSGPVPSGDGFALAVAPPTPVVAMAPAVATAPAAPTAPMPIHPEPVPPTAMSTAPPSPPASAEIEALFAAFVESYEKGRVDAFAALFDDDADTNLRHGRAAIRGEYDELFRLSDWRRMQLTRVNWRRAGDRAYAKGEIAVRIGWRDGREVEQRLAVDMELVRRDGRVVIARLSHQPRNP